MALSGNSNVIKWFSDYWCLIIIIKIQYNNHRTYLKKYTIQI